MRFQEFAESLVVIAEFLDFLRRNYITYGYVDCGVAFFPYFGREAQCAQLPAYHAQQIEECAVATMEEDWHYRDTHLAHQADYGGLPLAVLYAQISVDFAYCASREESQRFA